MSFPFFLIYYHNNFANILVHLIQFTFFIRIIKMKSYYINLYVQLSVMFWMHSCCHQNKPFYFFIITVLRLSFRSFVLFKISLYVTLQKKNQRAVIFQVSLWSPFFLKIVFYGTFSVYWFYSKEQKSKKMSSMFITLLS